MEARSVTLPNNLTVKMGRNRPVAPCPRLKLADYLLRALPPPPASVDYTPAAKGVLAQMYLNDQLGDCVIACMAHIEGLFHANAGDAPLIYTPQQIISLYSAIGGYVPGNPRTDRGCNEQTALNYWQHSGATSGHKIAGWVAVNPQDPAEYRAALWLFENLVYGIELPDVWIQQARPGFIWDVAMPNPQNGHCIAGVGYDASGIHVSTWGMVGTITDRAMSSVMSRRYGGELYCVISQHAINQASQKAANGFDWAALVADFNSLGGNVTPPPPAPPTPPPIPPVPPVPVPGDFTGIALFKGNDLALQYDLVPRK